MSDHAEDEAVAPDVSHLVTEDDTPVDSLFQEKQMRLLVEPLYSSWRPVDEHGERRPFVAAADVGIFGSVHERAVVLDVLLSLDVDVPDEFWKKERRSYYIWEFGKPPEIVVEIVSNREGDELEGKRATYSRLRIAHYVVFNHLKLYGTAALRVFELRGDLLVPSTEARFARFGLGLTTWTEASRVNEPSGCAGAAWMARSFQQAMSAPSTDVSAPSTSVSAPSTSVSAPSTSVSAPTGWLRSYASSASSRNSPRRIPFSCASTPTSQDAKSSYPVQPEAVLLGAAILGAVGGWPVLDRGRRDGLV